MKTKIYFTSLALLFVLTGIAFAADFSPTQLTISSDEILPYSFGGELTFPVTVSGTGAQVVFCVYTRDKAGEIGIVRNGYLGWHYVNKVDTCIYFSSPYQFAPGVNTVVWDGCDQDGNPVEPGEYTYYLWGYDNVSPKMLMCRDLYSGWGFDFDSNILEKDEDGLPLANPLWYEARNGALRMWSIGSDPLDESMLVSSMLPVRENWASNRQPLIDPHENSRFYLLNVNGEEQLAAIRKYRWIPGGTAEDDLSFGDSGMSDAYHSLGSNLPGVDSDGEYLFAIDENHTTSNDPDAEFFIYDFNGGLVATVDLTPWWSSEEDFEKGAQMNGGPININVSGDKAFLGGHANCLDQMVAPGRYLESGLTEDFYAWSNGNGDYVLDKNFAETADVPWACNDYNVGPYKYSFSADRNFFAVDGFYDPDTELSFGLLGPDGTGIGYFAFAGQTNGWNKGVVILDGDTPFDGFYCDNEQTMGPHFDRNDSLKEPGIFFIGQDTFKGVISPEGHYLSIRTISDNAVFAIGQPLEIIWYSKDVAAVNIEFSPDNGVSWQEIALDVDAAPGSYEWIAPETETQTALIRISNSDDESVTSTSHSPFSIQYPTVDLVTPDGGAFDIGASIEIEWDSFGVDTVSLEFSNDAGETWESVAVDVDASIKKYSWTLQDAPADECLIRISQADNSLINDQSASFFKISEKYVDLLAPDGGETFQTRHSAAITWNASTSISSLKIEYSSDDGANWHLITSGADASGGVYVWTISSSAQTGDYLIRISSAADASISDTISASFSVIENTVDYSAFSPTLLKLSADEIVPYDFNGDFELPLTVSGTPAMLIFSVFTKDRAESIGEIRNGYLGWHYVNKVDTCVYYSAPKHLQVGRTTISWDGLDQDGGRVTPGEYTYYLWGFDNYNAKQLMSAYLHSGWGFDMTCDIQEVDESGLPLANPIWYRAQERWIVGGDPNDESLLAKTVLTLDEGWQTAGEPALDPNDHDYMYCFVRNSVAQQGAIQKYRFVPGGDAEIQQGWGGEPPYSDVFATVGGGSAGVVTDGFYMYTTDENHTASNDADAEFYIFDLDGYLVDEIDISLWWSSQEDFDKGGQMNGGPNNFHERHGFMFLNCHCNCLNQMVDPKRYLDSGDIDDLFVWSNGNGDYTLDHNFEETADKPWICNDYNVGPYKYSISADDNLFSMANAYDAGAVSFGLLAPDGTGLGYYAYAGETAGWKKGSVFLDSGTPYDGIYCDNEQTGGWGQYKTADTSASAAISANSGIYFIGHDSIKGTITANLHYIWVTSPVESELIASGTRYTISWKSNQVATVKIEFSSDNGGNWEAVADNIEAAKGSWEWTTPDIASDTCLLRVRDTDDPGISGVTKGPFRISPPFIRLLSPNGGETAERGIGLTVSWEQMGGGTLRLEYSLDNGATWHVGLDDVDASMGNCRWTVPDELSSTALVRVSDKDNESLTDVSDAVFSIKDSFIDLTNQAGSGPLEARSTFLITWESSSGVQKAGLAYSIDNGVSWLTIAENVDAAKGSYAWRVPVMTAGECLLKIYSMENMNLLDISDEAFAVALPSSWDEGWVTYRAEDGLGFDNFWVVAADHNGGVWAGSTGAGIAYFNGISWTHYSTENSGIATDDIYTIAVDHDNLVWFGSTFEDVVTTFDGASWVSYWNKIGAIRDIQVDHDNVKWFGSQVSGICSYDGLTWTRYTPENSGLREGDTEILGIGPDNNVWIGSKFGNGVTRYDGVTWTTYTTSDGLIDNEVRGIAFTEDGAVWFGTRRGVSRFDGESWESFSSSDGLANNSVWCVAVDYDDVVWFATNSGVSSFDGLTWKSYTSDNSPLENNRVWKVAVDTNNIKWFATRGGGISSFDYTAGPYTRVTRPNGHDLLPAGGSTTIGWQSRDVETVSLEYSLDGGDSWRMIASGLDASPGEYTWQLPTDTSRECLVRISDSADATINDVSNSAFTVSDPFVELEAPIGGEYVPADKPYVIRWTSIGIESFDLLLSTDGGAHWKTFVTGIDPAPGKYYWTVPNERSETCLLRLADSSNAGRADTSDAEFSIIQSRIVVLGPNGGEVYNADSLPVINWVSSGVDYVDIDYSVDGGLSWNPIAERFDAEKETFLWQPEEVQSMLCVVRVSDSDNSDIHDVSDEVFKFILYTLVDSGTPEAFSVSQNMPNPFNPSTTLSFTLPETRAVAVDVFNLSGQRVIRLVERELPAGRHSVTWDAGGLSAGVYLCRVVAGMDVQTVKMALLK